MIPKTEKKQNKNTTQYELDTTMRKQTQITWIRHAPSYKQLQVKTNWTSFLCGYRSVVNLCNHFQRKFKDFIEDTAFGSWETYSWWFHYRYCVWLVGDLLLGSHIGKQYFSYILAVSFMDGARTPEYLEMTTDLPQVTDKLYQSHNVISSTPHLSGIRTHNVSGDRHWLSR
jgi:hypothetical protein